MTGSPPTRSHGPVSYTHLDVYKRQQERRTLRATLIPVEHELAGALLHIEDLTETLAYEARANAAEHLAGGGEHVVLELSHGPGGEPPRRHPTPRSCLLYTSRCV